MSYIKNDYKDPNSNYGGGWSDQIIRQLNKELSGMGLITVPGRVDANYFKKKLFYEEK